MKNQSEVGRKIDQMTNELKELDKVCDEFQIQKATESLNESRRKLITANATLKLISERLSKLIQAAALKYPELEEVNKYNRKISNATTSEPKEEQTTEGSIAPNQTTEKSSDDRISVDSSILNDFTPKILRPENNTDEPLLNEQDLKNVINFLI
jgi:paraquat-inducible protein B